MTKPQLNIILHYRVPSFQLGGNMDNVLKTRRISLQKAQSSDMPLLAAWQTTLIYKEFVNDCSRMKYHSRYLILRQSSHERVGEIYTFSFNKNDGYLFLNVFLVDKYRRVGYAAEACILLICHLFDTEDLYKIYCDALTNNGPSISMMRSAGLKQEGLLKGHRLYQGKRYDVARFAIHKKNLPHLLELLKKFKKKSGS